MDSWIWNSLIVCDAYFPICKIVDMYVILEIDSKGMGVWNVGLIKSSLPSLVGIVMEIFQHC